MSYTKVTFSQSFEDWAAQNNIPLKCGCSPWRDHGDTCQVTAARKVWREAGQARYAGLGGGA